MKNHTGISRRWFGGVAGITILAACAAGIAAFAARTPVPGGSPGTTVASETTPSPRAQRSGGKAVIQDKDSGDAAGLVQQAEPPAPAAGTTSSDRHETNAELAVLLDWHVGMRHGYEARPDRIDRLPKPG
jgi:hypothetical protein